MILKNPVKISVTLIDKKKRWCFLRWVDLVQKKVISVLMREE